MTNFLTPISPFLIPSFPSQLHLSDSFDPVVRIALLSSFWFERTCSWSEASCDISFSPAEVYHQKTGAVIGSFENLQVDQFN